MIQAVAALGALTYLGVVAGGRKGWPTLVKLVPACALAAGAWTRSPAWSAALVLYALGDAFLLDKGRRFIPGLVAFLLGHLVFITLLAARVGWSPVAGAGGAVVAALMCVALWPALQGPLRVAVPIYAAALAGVVAVFAPLGAIGTAGALLFLLSDALLAWQKFRGPLPGLPPPRGDLAVLVTYFAAIGAMAHALPTGPPLP